MSTAFFKIQCEFTMKDDTSEEDNEPVLAQYVPEVSDGIVLNFIPTDGNTISFTAHKVEIEAGDFSIEKNGTNLHIKCNAVFKKSVKPDHFETVEKSDGKWYSSGLKGVYGLIDGLVPEKYMEKNRFGEFECLRYLIEVEVSQKKIHL